MKYRRYLLIVIVIIILIGLIYSQWDAHTEHAPEAVAEPQQNERGYLDTTPVPLQPLEFLSEQDVDTRLIDCTIKIPRGTNLYSYDDEHGSSYYGDSYWLRFTHVSELAEDTQVKLLTCQYSIVGRHERSDTVYLAVDLPQYGRVYVDWQTVILPPRLALLKERWPRYWHVIGAPSGRKYEVLLSSPMEDFRRTVTNGDVSLSVMDNAGNILVAVEWVGWKAETEWKQFDDDREKELTIVGSGGNGVGVTTFTVLDFSRGVLADTTFQITGGVVTDTDLEGDGKLELFVPEQPWGSRSPEWKAFYAWNGRAAVCVSERYPAYYQNIYLPELREWKRYYEANPDRQHDDEYDTGLSMIDKINILIRRAEKLIADHPVAHH